MAENRVVIKINYDKDKHRKAIIDPKMVTVWHTKRILVAVAILLGIIVLIYTGFSNDDASKHNPQSAEALNNTPGAIEQTPIEIPASTTSLPAVQEVVDIKKRPSAIILDRRVIRASLNTAFRNDEPADPIISPVTIEPNQSVELFYFSEVKNMKDKVLFHHWFKDGQVIFKKQLEIKANKSKLISSKKLTAKDGGDWQVVLVDNKGKLFSEVNFFVNPK